ncbi:TnsA endonuclease N-terminal domain-containing protein [Endozoicomonas sp. G2_1]|uniref:TnsA endonuclease N-terminal domain-containing protein n=1 Tax=Endozoicomonas sp. G2_1 TaxID=2821091 RepID=UPI001ADB0609|nr:TnsA endonuclease N-terminal domain-containing protein [Endozoicomonas sp. G2_1]MBO9490457.1 TnsA endonuclease N-terminal domain-containing protein [Endozoicomonas sp. G2_1]
MSIAQRKIKAGYANLTAKVPSKKLNKMVDAESSLERDFVLILDSDPHVTHFLEQPIKIGLEGNRTYTPDFMVTYNNKKTVIYEVKYRSELQKNFNKLKPKFKAAIKYCNQQGYKFKIITDKEIRTQRLKNLEFLSRFNLTVSHSEEAFRDAILRSFVDLGDATPKELLAATFSSKIKQAEAMPVLWRMIYSGVISVDLNLPLSMDSALMLDSELRSTVC